jgi:molybdenum cofactor cytidylyltransferase
MSIDAVVLAAGLSTRAGFFKMALPLGDKTLIERSIEGLYEVCSKLYVVGGFEIERIREILKDYSKVSVVYNKNFMKGMFTSVKEGIQHVRAPSFYLLPGDYPLVRDHVLQEMLRVEADIVIPTYRGRKGHPVYFKTHLVDEILHEPDDATLRDFINRKGYVTVEVDDEGIIIDVDSPEDYERVKALYEREVTRSRKES